MIETWRMTSLFLSGISFGLADLWRGGERQRVAARLCELKTRHSHIVYGFLRQELGPADADELADLIADGITWMCPAGPR